MPSPAYLLTCTTSVRSIPSVRPVANLCRCRADGPSGPASPWSARTLFYAFAFLPFRFVSHAFPLPRIKYAPNIYRLTPPRRIDQRRPHHHLSFSTQRHTLKVTRPNFFLQPRFQIRKKILFRCTESHGHIIPLNSIHAVLSKLSSSSATQPSPNIFSTSLPYTLPNLVLSNFI